MIFMNLISVSCFMSVLKIAGITCQEGTRSDALEADTQVSK